MHSTVTITIVGFGHVGRTVALLLLQQNVGAKLHLNILDFEDTVRGSLLDFGQSLFLFDTGCELFINNQQLFKTSDIIIHCAGTSVPAGASRRVTRNANIEICRSIFSQTTFKADTKIIVVSNPVDAISHAVYYYSGLPAHQVFGVGTYLDSIRFRYFATKQAGANYQATSMLLGEHGEAIVYMSAYDNLSNLFPQHDAYTRLLETCMQETIRAAQEIKKTQGASYYAVAKCVGEIVFAIQHDTKKIIPLSVVLPISLSVKWQLESEVYMSMPVKIGRRGVLQYPELQATAVEWDRLKKAAYQLRDLQL